MAHPTAQLFTGGPSATSDILAMGLAEGPIQAGEASVLVVELAAIARFAWLVASQTPIASLGADKSASAVLVGLAWNTHC